jgi:hypothetical protein
MAYLNIVEKRTKEVGKNDEISKYEDWFWRISAGNWKDGKAG